MTENSKGREKAILEMDLKIDDLLEKKNQGVEQLDMEYGASLLFPISPDHSTLTLCCRQQ